MKSVLAALLAAFTLTACAGTGQKTVSEVIVLGIATKPGSAQYVAAEKFKELSEARSNGQIFVRIADSGALGSETGILEKIRENEAQMGVITAAAFDSIAPETRVLGLPFLFNNYEEADAVLTGPAGDALLKSLGRADLVGLAFSENGFRNLTNNRRPVAAPACVSGLRVRVMESALQRALWEELGADPVEMPWPITQALANGTIDGQENPLWVIDLYGFDQYQKYLSLTRHVYSPHIAVASETWWEGLSADLKDVVASSMADAAMFQRTENRKAEAAHLKALKDRGMIVNEHPDREAFRERTRALAASPLLASPRVQARLNQVMEAVQAAREAR